MTKLPICINIDDHTPYIHLYHYHIKARGSDKSPTTSYGALMVDKVPYSFLENFCDVCEENGIMGKLSYVPCPAGLGDITRGIEGVSGSDLRKWMETVDTRLKGRFSFCAEMISHHYAYNVLNGSWLDINEDKWSRLNQTRGTMTPYIAHALKILRDAGIDATGVTSPWMFGETVADEYRAAIALAMRDVYGRTKSWHFTFSGDKHPEKYEPVKGLTVCSINSTISDSFWASLSSYDMSEEFVNGIADKYITEDGSKGAIIDKLALGLPVIMTAHWQSLFANGHRTGLRALEKIAQRVNSHLSDRVEWMNFDKLLEHY